MEYKELQCLESFLSISPQNSNSLCHKCPTHLPFNCPTNLSYKCPTHLSHKCPTHLPFNCPTNLSHKCPTHLSHKCPTHLSHKRSHSHILIMVNFTLYVCAEDFHIMNIDVPASVGASPLDTQLFSVVLCFVLYLMCVLSVLINNITDEDPQNEALGPLT